MAEFVQTMKDWHRMCESCDRNEKIGCIVNGSVCAGFRKMINEIDLEVVEAKVTAWATEHPEPVYPTWSDYLHSIGVLYKKHTASGDVTSINWGYMMAPIPDDKAKKLGLKPKEAQHG